jgi:hypothetical protein
MFLLLSFFVLSENHLPLAPGTQRLTLDLILTTESDYEKQAKRKTAQPP